LQSEENKLWFSFLEKGKAYQAQFNLLEKEVDYFQSKLLDENSFSNADMGRPELERNALQIANAFNELQMERDRFILQIIQENKNMFASRLIRLFRVPFRDGYLTLDERRESFQKAYFNDFDFSDRLLINSTVLTDKIFDYLVTWNQRGFAQDQREMAYIKAVDFIMSYLDQFNANQGNNPVYEFVLNYLVTGFERLNMEFVLNHIAENYLDNLCRTDEKTTLARKLGAQNMKTGSVVPDFTLNDLNGDPVSLSRVLKSRTLILFWASWCSHCTEMLPQLKTWYSQNQPEDFVVIAISLDNSKEEWQSAVFSSGFEIFYNLSDLKHWDGKTAEDYNIYATPTMFLINQEQKILAKPGSLNDLIKSSGKI
jgi:peroxiredoxin